ncbi:MAG TPA: tetratricopeptide repeat protein [Methylomirabilota bacterium]|nr:tetratricopeptide repeat protein [Methylomirabilota bacterium]
MRARRLGRASALAGLLLGLSADPGHAQPADVRIVTLRAVAEEMYRARPGWEADLRRTVKTVSDIYEQNFQIRLVIRDIVPWTVGPGVPLQTILRRLRTEVPIGPADVLVGFAAERCERLEYGVATVFGRVAMVQTGCLDTAVLSNTTAEAVLSHEMGHLFGAFHPAPSHDVSVMRGGPADRFDRQSLRVIRLMRNFDFTRGVRSVDATARQAWSAIYAEGHPRDEPNPLAGAIGNEGARLAAIGREQEGEALLREALAVDPNAARVHTMLGLLYQRQNRLPDAARELEAAKRLSFRETEARTALGFVLLQLGRDDEALTELRDVLRVDRRLARPHLGVGMIMARRDRMPEAIGAFRSAIALEPKDGPAYLQLAEPSTGRTSPRRRGPPRSRPTISARPCPPTSGNGSRRRFRRRRRCRPRAARRPARSSTWTIRTRPRATTSPRSASASGRTWPTRASPASDASRVSCRSSSRSPGAGGSSAWRCAARRAPRSSTVTRWTGSDSPSRSRRCLRRCRSRRSRSAAPSRTASSTSRPRCRPLASDGLDAALAATAPGSPRRGAVRYGG